jgi:hypothetical protein
MGLIGTALAKSGIPAAFEAAKEFLGKIAGPAAEEVGLLLQDKVRIYRFGTMTGGIRKMRISRLQTLKLINRPCKLLDFPI